MNTPLNSMPRRLVTLAGRLALSGAAMSLAALTGAAPAHAEPVDKVTIIVTFPTEFRDEAAAKLESADPDFVAKALRQLCAVAPHELLVRQGRSNAFRLIQLRDYNSSPITHNGSLHTSSCTFGARFRVPPGVKSMDVSFSTVPTLRLSGAALRAGTPHVLRPDLRSCERIILPDGRASTSCLAAWPRP